MGLGKTLEAIGVINADPSIRNVLVICPASLKLNWAREAQKWLVRPMKVSVANGTMNPGGFAIVNYEQVGKYRQTIQGTAWDLLVVDECHMAKNRKANRTQQIFGKWNSEKREWDISPLQARRRIFLTGTPILNRPIELWTLVHALDRKGLGANWRSFAVRYCGGRQGRFGWVTDGASNLDELNTKLRAAFMLRRLKSEVLTELPPKFRQAILLEPSVRARMLIEQQNALALTLEGAKEALFVASEASDPNAFKTALAALHNASGASFREISRIRHELGLEKVPQVIEHIREQLDGGDKIVVMAHHLDVIDAIVDAFALEGAVKLTGEMSVGDKQAAVDRFQRDSACRLLVGTIKAAGIGFTMVASSTVVFAEQDWTWGWNVQAEDRVHRIGQTSNHVLVQYLLLDGSLDARIAQLNLEKKEIGDEALDGAGAALTAPVALVAPEPPPPQATEKPAGSHPQPAPPEMAPDQIKAVHEALRLLAGLDWDRALELNDIGFNRLDGDFGHDLANREWLTQRQAAAGAKMLMKYRRQLGDELLARIKGGA